MLDNVAGWAVENAFAGLGLDKLWGKTWSGEALILCRQRNRHAAHFATCCAALSTLIE
jgi:hypothetical protein